MSQTKRNRNYSKTDSENQKRVFNFPLFRAIPTTEYDSNLQKSFKILFCVFSIIMIGLALNSGINADDEYQNDYSEKLVNYYTSFGEDTAALNIEKGKMHLYGGLFDLITGFLNHSLGYEKLDWQYHQVRHVCNALFGILILLFSGLLAKEIVGWRASILVLALLFLSPRFLGHTLMNPKDIPFAAGFAIALYYMVLFFKNYVAVSKKIMAGLVIGMAIAIGTRVGGVLLIFYFGLFGSVYYLKHKELELKRLITYILGISIASFFLALLFWPYGLVSPIAHTFEALAEFSKLGTRIRLLHEGANVMSDATSWTYPLRWFWQTLPAFALLGFLGFILFSKRIFQKYSPLPLLLCLFAFLFPMIYVLLTNATLHDGWRHLIFIYPPMIVLVVVFGLYLDNLFKKAAYRISVFMLTGFLISGPALFILNNKQIPYTFFNVVSGGMGSAFGHYETDYWGLSIKSGVDWLEEEQILNPNREDTLRLATTFYYPLKVLVEKKYAGKVKVVYTPFNQRYEKEWDYGLFPSRFLRGPHLQNGTWPNSKAIKVFESNDVPILAIEGGIDKTIFEAEKLYNSEHFQQAISLYEKELKSHPDNELAWLKKANAYSNLEQFYEVITSADKALEVAPENTNAWFQKAFANLSLGNKEEAFVQFRKTTEINPKFAPGFFQMALLQLEFNDPKSAYENALNAIKAAPNYKPAYRMAASILESRGEHQRAQRFLNTLKRLE